jgi:epoxyqueuosine reductase
MAETLTARFDCRSKPYVDSGPVFEKAWAAAAGLGFLGRNTLLITPQFGSLVFLGAIVTDLAFEPEPEGPCEDCGSCRACVEACPTGALDGDGNLDVSRCLAHLTVSSKSPIPAEFRTALAGNLYGCDVCQDVCPRNRAIDRPGRPEFGPLPGLYFPELAGIRAMDEDAFTRWSGTSPIRRRGLPLVRHVAEILDR